MLPIKNIETYFMAHQYVPKIFHDPPQKPSDPPPTYLMYGPLGSETDTKLLLYHVTIIRTRIALENHLFFVRISL